MTVAKSLPHLLQKVRKLLIPKLFLSYSCILYKNTIVYKEQDGQYDYAIIETLTADKLVLHNKYHILVNPDLPTNAQHYTSGDYTETYTRMKE